MKKQNERYYLILNQDAKPFEYINAAAHTALGLATMGVCSEDEVSEFRFSDQRFLAQLTDLPYIILKANSSEQISNLWFNLEAHDIPANAFVRRMLNGTVEQQIGSIAEQNPDEVQDFLALSFKGETKKLQKLTKHFDMF